MSNHKHHIEEVTARLQRAVVAHAPHQEAAAAQTAVPVAPKTAETLAGFGYPLRACLALPSMTGKGLRVANSLVPLAMKDGTILLFGATGRGKTVMATYLAFQRMVAGKKPGLFTEAREIFARMKQCWTKGEDSEAVMKKWRETPFLVIDEMQSRSEIAWENNELDHLVNKRYAAMLPTVLIGNFANEIEAQQSLGPRIIDRVRETGHCVPCDWASYRG